MEPTNGTLAVSSFDIGGILSRSASTLFKNPAVFFGLSFLAIIPAVAIGAFVVMSGDPSTMMVGMSIVGIVTMVLNLLVQGAIAYGAFNAIKGNIVSIGAAVSHVTPRLVAIFLTSLLAGLGIGVGLILLIIPGLILMCFWSVAIPACVVEKTGAVDSLKRSVELTKGFRWKIFALYLIVGLINYAITFVAGLIFGGAPLLGFIVPQLFAFIISAFSAVMTAVIYYDLRMAKEGIDIDALVNVFE